MIPELNNIDAIIFDFDGTLYDYKDFSRNLIKGMPFFALLMYKERVVHNGLKGQSFDSVNAYNDVYFGAIAKKSIFSRKFIENWFYKKYMKNFAKVLRKKYKPRENIIEVFDALYKKNIKTSILSDYPNVKERLQALGVTAESIHCEDTCFSTEQLFCFKPAAQMFIKVADVLKVSPERVLVVGDRNDTDGEGARLSGMKFVQISTYKNGTDKDTVKHPFLSWEEFSDFILQ